MQKQRIILIAGVVLGLIAIYFINVYLNQQRQIYQEEIRRLVTNVQTAQTNQVGVLVAKQDIPRGTAIGPEMLETKNFPREYVAPQAVTSLDRISGMVAVTQIPQGEQITLSKLAYPRQVGGLAEVTPVGKRAITINVDNLASLAGMVKPGNYVDLIAMLPVPVQIAEGKQATQIASVPLFQNVLVLAVGQETGSVRATGAEGRYAKGEAGQQRQEASSLITLALSPEEANLVSFVQEQGKFRLVLRSPADSQMQPLRPITWDALFQYLVPSQTAKQPREETEATAGGYVEIYRGAKKERVPLSK
jgi:pilus assembly protein CpaB